MPGLLAHDPVDEHLALLDGGLRFPTRQAGMSGDEGQVEAQEPDSRKPYFGWGTKRR